MLAVVFKVYIVQKLLLINCVLSTGGFCQLTSSIIFLFMYIANCLYDCAITDVLQKLTKELESVKRVSVFSTYVKKSNTILKIFTNFKQDTVHHILCHTAPDPLASYMKKGWRNTLKH